MKSKLALATMLAVALVAPAALPCGAPFGNNINVDPKQNIVVVHKNGTETYVFQPRFCGSAKEFGFILPVPAKLSAQPALSKAEVFSRLDAISYPTIQYVTACQNRGMGGSAGGRPDASMTDSGTSVVSSGKVGIMDYAQLETSSLDALTSWLTSNGYPYDSLAQSAFQYYVDKAWLFVAFKISQGLDAGTAVCSDLGPIKLSFPTATPVVPTRMATARARDTSGATPYASAFSWKIYGITDGAEQVGFGTSSGSATRVLNYSGLLTAEDISYLDGLAVAGDRADKLTVTFNYGSTDPDIGLAKVAGNDYREVITYTTYITCTDGGADTADARADGPTDVAVLKDTAPFGEDTATQPGPDVATLPEDAFVPNPPEGPGKADAASVVLEDAATVTPPGPDANVLLADAAPPVVQPVIQDSGCSCSAGAGAGNLAPALVTVLVLGLLRRRR
jgi:MYXO-CTERM domain-containing protein